MARVARGGEGAKLGVVGAVTECEEGVLRFELSMRDQRRLLFAVDSGSGGDVTDECASEVRGLGGSSSAATFGGEDEMMIGCCGRVEPSGGNSGIRLSNSACARLISPSTSSSSSSSSGTAGAGSGS